jgi:peroxiredoxin
VIAMMRWAALGSILATAACSDPALTKRLDDLEAKVVTLEETVAKAPAAAPGKPAGPSADDQAAMQLFKEASDASRGGDTETAKAKLTQLNEKYKGTRAAGAGARLLAELSVVGKDAGVFEADKWLQGETSFAEGKATLLVFWEVWCPHCKREVPKMQATFEKFQSQGLNLVGLTKLTRGKTEEDVMAFIKEQKVTYPLAKESGSMSARFGVNGVPAAAVVKEGKVVWRGHPAQITEEMINGWIN